jgi:hypothetical protein
MALRSWETNKGNVTDDFPEEDARQQPKKKARPNPAAQKTGGEIGAESDDGDRSSADPLFDDDASKSVEEVAYPTVPPGSEIYRVFSPDQAFQWFKTPPIQGTQADK